MGYEGNKFCKGHVKIKAHQVLERLERRELWAANANSFVDMSARLAKAMHPDIPDEVWTEAKTADDTIRK
eukprot:14603336-Heterocapsa_arctica.AAC.1